MVRDIQEPMPFFLGLASRPGDPLKGVDGDDIDVLAVMADDVREIVDGIIDVFAYLVSIIETSMYFPALSLLPWTPTRILSCK